jgi:hypothetical protein
LRWPPAVPFVSTAEAVLPSEFNYRLLQLISVCRHGVKPGNNRESIRISRVSGD